MSTATPTRHLEIIERLDAGERLHADDARTLIESRDVVAVAAAARRASPARTARRT